MAKQHLLAVALILSGSVMFAACSDVSVTDGGGGAAGEAGAKGEAGGKGEDNGEGGEAGVVPTFTFPDSLNPQAVLVPMPSPATSTQLLVAGTDYKKTEIVSVTIGTGTGANAETYDDGDTIPASSAGIGFAIERSNDKLHLLDAGKISTTFDLRDAGTDTQPVESKAYVPFLNQSFVAILDLTEGKVSRRIDLREYNVAGDSDHSADIAATAYDPAGKIAYFVLQRIDRNSANAAPYQLACPKAAGLIVGINAVTDEEVDLNGSGVGKAIELELVNQSSVSINADGTALYLSAAGCYDAGTLKRNGVEVVDLTDGTSQVAYSPEGDDRLDNLIMTGGADALLKTQDVSFTDHWFKLDIAAGKLGDELPNVPSSVTFDGKDLLGVQVTGNVGAVVRYDIAKGTTKTISETSWAGMYGTAYGTALVQ